MYSSVIVPLDGSPLAERALPVAAALARQVGATLQLVSAVQDRAEASERQRYLDARAAAVDGAAVLPPIAAEHAAEALVEIVDARTDALLCMGTHGSSGVRRALLGSVAEAVARRIPGPLLLVGPHCEAPVGPFQRLIVTLDGSPSSSSILQVATAWAQSLRVPVMLVNVVSPQAADAARAADSAEEGQVAGVARDLARIGVAASWEVLHGDDAAEAITRYAAEQPGSIVVSSTHGRGGLARIAMGSVTMRVAHESRCPVLVQRPRGLK